MKKFWPFKKRFLILATIVILICFGRYVFQKFGGLIEKPGVQKVTGFTWPKGTKILEWMFASMQGKWVKMHLQLPPSFQCDTTNFIRFDPAYTNVYNPAKMDENRWHKQRQVYRDQKGIFLFNDMKSSPVASTNLLFSASNRLANTIPWAIVYDESNCQMWIFCY